MHSSLGLHRVRGETGTLPQAARRLDPSGEIGPDEVRVRVEMLNLDAASYRQLHTEHGGDGEAIRKAVLAIVADRGKMHNPVTGSGGMLTGTVEEVGHESPRGFTPGDKVATLVSLTLTPLEILDGLARWDGLSEQVPCDGRAILFGRSIAAVLPDDLPAPLALAVMDVCGAPALTRRVVRAHRDGRALAADPPARGADDSSTAVEGGQRDIDSPWAGAATGGSGPVVAVIGASGKSGSLSAAAARDAGAGRVIGVVPTQDEAKLLGTGLVDEVVVADARDPVALAREITARSGGAVGGGADGAVGGGADVTVVCVDVPGCEGGAILATKNGGTIVFFSMATSFSAAALGAEGVAADVTMLIGNGYVPGHAEYALELLRGNPHVRALFERRLT